MSTAIRALLALLLGYIVQEVLVITAGVAAARATPQGYFEFFGRQNLEVASGLWSLGNFAIPQLVLAFVLAFGTIRLLKFDRALSYVFVAGALLCWLRYMIYLPSPDTGEHQLASASQFMSLVRAIYFQDPWLMPASWASWFGLLAGATVAVRRTRRSPPSSAEA